MERKLYRSSHDRILGGVCGGLGAYLGVDSNLVRLVFVLLALVNGTGVILYLAMWLLLPMEEGPGQERPAAEFPARAREAARGLAPHLGLWLGLGLVAVGVLFLLRNLGVLWAPWLRFEVLWPALLILAGLAVLVKGAR